MSSVGVANVYKYRPVEGLEWLLPVVSQDSRKLRFDGTPRAAAWTPVRVNRLRRWEDGTALMPGDFPAGSGFAVSRAAKEHLGSCLEEAGELLPLECRNGEFWTLNVTRLLDALDEERSEVLRATDTGEILMIHRHSLIRERLGPEIFKLSQTPRGSIYFTEAFVNRVRATPLKGIDFKLVWSAS